jgi:hypothetical protein
MRAQKYIFPNDKKSKAKSQKKVESNKRKNMFFQFLS